MNAELTPYPDRLVVAASALVDMLEAARRVHPKNWSEAVRRYLGVGFEGRWDTTLVWAAGQLSHYDYVKNCSNWPIPREPTPNRLAAFGRRYGLLRRDVKVGDIVLHYGPAHAGFVRVGIAAAIVRRGHWSPNRPYVDVLSIEGASSELMMPDDTHAMRLTRRLAASSGDRFLRWTAIKWNAAPEGR